MLNPKVKGLFLDVSDFSVLAARTSGFKLPLTVEAVDEYILSGSDSAEDIRSFLESLVDFKKSNHFISRCGVYPEGRFVHYHEVESVIKAKKLDFLSKTLEQEFKIDPEENEIAILDARDGSDFDPNTSLTKYLVFCGGPTEAFQEKQDRLLQFGVYPKRLELSTCATLGGVSDYARFKEIKSPILFLELTLKSTNVFILNRGKIEVSHTSEMGLDSIYPLLQRELGLKDESSARKLFLSNTFDFAEIGPKLLRRITKELQATTGFYEVQTGQTIEHLFLSVLPGNLSWVENTFADALALDVLKPNYGSWLESLKIEIGDGVEVSNMNGRWMGLFSLMAEFDSVEKGWDEA
ncbi:MAG: hypothetical protein GVY36_07890 [Verrucomicrobia bacterium]|jgi:hypothetical protein|nr:hypothetical protein [Verrucomicrobiota bacterium]